MAENLWIDLRILLRHINAAQFLLLRTFGSQKSLQQNFNLKDLTSRISNAQTKSVEK